MCVWQGVLGPLTSGFLSWNLLICDKGTDMPTTGTDGELAVSQGLFPLLAYDGWDHSLSWVVDFTETRILGMEP